MILTNNTLSKSFVIKPKYKTKNYNIKKFSIKSFTLRLKNHIMPRKSKETRYSLQHVSFPNSRLIEANFLNVNTYLYLLLLNSNKHLIKIDFLHTRFLLKSSLTTSSLLLTYKAPLNSIHFKDKQLVLRYVSNPSQNIFMHKSCLYPNYKNIQATMESVWGRITNITNYYYVEYYFSLLIHNNILKNSNKNKILSLYPVRCNSFVKGTSFSSSLENVIKFQRFFFKNKIRKQPKQLIPSLLFIKILFSLKTKFFFKKNMYIFNFYKNKLKSNILKFIRIMTPFLVKYRSKNFTKYKFFKFFFKRNFIKIYYKSNRTVDKKLRYLKFVSRTKGFSKNFKSNVLVRTKKLLPFSNIYTGNLNYIRLNNTKSARFTLKKKQKISNTKLLFLDKEVFKEVSYITKPLTLLLFFKDSCFLKVLNFLNFFFIKVYNNINTLKNFLNKITCVKSLNTNFNIIPSSSFNFKIKKLLTSNNYNVFFKENLTP